MIRSTRCGPLQSISAISRQMIGISVPNLRRPILKCYIPSQKKKFSAGSKPAYKTMVLCCANLRTTALSMTLRLERRPPAPRPRRKRPKSSAKRPRRSKPKPNPRQTARPRWHKRPLLRFPRLPQSRKANRLCTPPLPRPKPQLPQLAIPSLISSNASAPLSLSVARPNLLKINKPPRILAHSKPRQIHLT